MASNFYYNDIEPSTSRDASEPFQMKTSSSSENMQSRNSRPKKSFLTLSTGGFGLVVKETEEEKRLREQRDINYAMFSKKRKTEQENYDYVNHYNYKSDFKQELKEISAHLNSASISSANTNNDQNNQIGSDYIQLSNIKPEFDEADEHDLEIYQNTIYNLLNPHYNKNLPIYKCKNDILNSIRTNNVIIIQGNTGCGKTTQVPQYILDHYASMNKRCNIIVTQPRRLAAISIARRVCDERGWSLGSICGYRIARESKVSTLTKISYVTTGFLLAQAIGLADSLNSYTHIILDEVHDRELDIDLVILIVKLLLSTGYKGKVILMSATLDPELLKCYFSEVSTNKNVDLVYCSYELHQVRQYYLDEIKNLFKSDVI
jgi:HrpA-like RNA helicase